ncbi:MAG: hypothetical protein P1P63_02820 [Treponemataceae bacterium]
MGRSFFDDDTDDFFTDQRKTLVNFDAALADDFPEINQSFDKMKELQEKDISTRISKAEEQLNKLEYELTEFLKV